MFIGTCRVTFRLAGNDSLKGKRQVSRSLITRLRNRFNVSVAEVDSVESHQALTIGISCVSKDVGYAADLIDAAVRFLAQDHRLSAEMIAVERDLLDDD